MGLFDVLESATGLGAPAAPARYGSPGPAGAPAAVAQMLQSQPGGVGAVLQQFEGAGLGGLAKSWLGEGAKAPISLGHVRTSLGRGAVGQVAQHLGVSHAATAHIAQFLPLILEHLGANGQAAGFGGLGGLLGRLNDVAAAGR
jgi:uncharacterized protein YidB (DUF937 family)